MIPTLSLSPLTCESPLLGHAGPASAPVVQDVDVLRRHRVSSLAVRSTLTLNLPASLVGVPVGALPRRPALGHHVRRVVRSRAEPEMRWVEAGWVVASVQDAQPRRNGSVCHRPGVPVREHAAPIHGHPPVAHGVSASLPFPATRRSVTGCHHRIEVGADLASRLTLVHLRSSRDEGRSEGSGCSTPRAFVILPAQTGGGPLATTSSRYRYSATVR